MSERDEFAVKSERIMTPHGEIAGAVWIRGGKIVDVVTEVPRELRVEDVGDAVVLPGLMDVHVHLNEPGRTQWEGFETGTRAAAAGGITTVIDMPLNSSPVTTTVEGLRAKLEAAAGKLSVDVGFHGGLVPGNAGEMEELVRAGCLGIKAFLVHSGIDEFPNATEKELREAMPELARLGVPLLVHAELELGEQMKGTDYSSWLASRPQSWEIEAIRLMIDLCREYQCRVHIVHLSAADALVDLAWARGEGVPITVETSPHYLYFDSAQIPQGDTRFKCAPPIREPDNRERLWQGLKAGQIDLIATDHSPCEPALKHLKKGDFTAAWGGISSLQLLLPIVWTEARRRRIPLVKVIDWLAAAPARLMGLSRKKGMIATGYDADMVVFDPDASFVVRPEMLQHRHKVTPYEGATLHGVVKKTYLRGTKVYDGGDFPAERIGQTILREGGAA